MNITLEDAKLLDRALRVLAQKLSTELQKILDSDESMYLVEAATARYNADAETYSTLHIRLMEAFPELIQP